MKYFLDENTDLYNRNLNKYSFPFSAKTQSITEFLKSLEIFQPFIHDIYLSCPGINGYFAKPLNILANRDNISYDEKCEELLKNLNNEYKTVITINGNYTLVPQKEKDNMCYYIAEKVSQYNIYGCIVSNYDMAKKLHELCPHLVLNTSCVISQPSAEYMIPWKRIGVNILNPQRNASRNIPLLKEFKSLGFKIKLLINELCDIQCPNLNYFCLRAQHDNDFNCYCKTTQNVLHSCILLPRWLNIMDEFVDIYKLQGRMRELNITLQQLKLYLLREDNCELSDLLCNIKIKHHIKLNEIPDQLLYCGQKCSKCNLCWDIMKKASVY